MNSRCRVSVSDRGNLLAIGTCVRYHCVMPTGIGPATRAVEQIENAINELADEEVVGCSLRDELVGLERSRARLDAEIARRLVEFQSSGEWAMEGARSAAGWLAAKTRCTSRVANHRVHVARQLAEMPTAIKAWRAGEIGGEHVAAMARVRSAGRANRRVRGVRTGVV